VLGMHGGGVSSAAAADDALVDEGPKVHHGGLHPFFAPDEYGFDTEVAAARPLYRNGIPPVIDSPSANDSPNGASEDLQPYRVWDTQDPDEAFQAAWLQRDSQEAPQAARVAEPTRAPDTDARKHRGIASASAKSETTVRVRLDADYGSFLESPDPEQRLKEWRERVAQHLGLPVSAVQLRRVQGP